LNSLQFRYRPRGMMRPRDRVSQSGCGWSHGHISLVWFGAV